MKATYYLFTYYDKQGNIITKRVLPCYGKKRSLEIAKDIISVSLMKDLYKIKTKRHPYYG